MDLGKTITIFLACLLLVWLFAITYTVNNNESTIRNYTEQIDSLTTKVQTLEKVIDNLDFTIVVNVNDEVKPKQK